MGFASIFQDKAHTQMMLKKQLECIRTIKINQDKLNINLLLKKALKDNYYAAYMVGMILNNKTDTKENKDKAVNLYIEWLNVMRNFIDKEQKDIHKLIWKKVFNDYLDILNCEENEYKEKLKYETFRIASLLKGKDIKLLEPMIMDTMGINRYKKHGEEIKKLLKGGKKSQYTLSTKVVETHMEKFCWFGRHDTSEYFDIFLECFVKRDSQYLPNLEKKIVETDKVEIIEKAVEKEVITASTRDELLEYALSKGCSKVIMNIILL